MDQEMRDMFQTVLDRLKSFELPIEEKFDMLDKRFDKIESILEQMQHEINACRREREEIELLIKRTVRLETGV